MAYEVGWQKHLWFKKETTWATAVTPDIWTPYQSYDVTMRPARYEGGMFVGVRQQRYAPEPVRHELSGTLNLPMWAYQVTSGSLKSVAQHLIDMALSAPAGIDLDSLTVNRSEVSDPKVHAGLRINTLTLTGSADGDGIIQMSLALMGHKETTGAAPSLVATVPHYRPMKFADSTFAVGGSTTQLNAFTLTVNNNLAFYYVNDYYPLLIEAGRRTITWQFVLPKNGQTYDTLRRATTITDTPVTGQLVLKGDHQGTGANTYTTATINIDRMTFQNIQDSDDMDAIVVSTLDYAIHKPNTTDNDVDITWGTAA